VTEHLQGLGVLALGSRLRAVSDRLFAQGDVVYERQGLNVSARWYPVLALLAERGPQPIMQIAKLSGLSHPYVIAITRKMAAAGYLDEARDPADERRRLVHLNAAGLALLEQLEPVWDGLRGVVKGAFERIGVDLVEALNRFEQDLQRNPWPEEMAKSLRQPIEIIDFEPRYAPDFRRLNVEWLEQYFQVEPVDLEVLDAPQEKVIDRGGAVLFARSADAIVGTCALKHEGDGVYELTKMGVTTQRRGAGIGAALLRAAIDRFVALGGRTLYLETNRLLQPAIRLYEGFGFVDQGHRKPGSIYERSNVYMIWSGDET
jgi:DNA-binding MarR family transcriptional regulator/ribosomal protein S18 acetylase RimI-like enzyme